MSDIFVARQPIFDANHNVVGYELLYRADGSCTTASGTSASAMSSSVIVGGVLGLGLDILTEGQTAFINLSDEMILDGTTELLDPKQVVIEILETVDPTGPMMDACRGLTEKGYRLALDDFVYDEALEPLLELADIVKVDVIQSSSELECTLERLRPFGVKLLAEKVENKEMHDRCVAQGFELFQGFHYFRPETLTKKDLSSNTVAVIRLMNLLQDPGVTDRSIEDAFKTGPGLTYKLLRIVNAASLGGRGVSSIAHALRLLGRDPLYRWLCLLLMTDGSGGGEMRIEMVKAALVRGHFCEAVSELARNPLNRDVPAGGAMFLVGLFSDIEMLLGVPVEEILEDINVTKTVRDAILHREGPGGSILAAVEAYTSGDWEGAGIEVSRLGADLPTLSDMYLNSITWASERMAFRTQPD